MIIKRPKQAVLTPCGLPAKMVFRAYRPPSDLLSMAKTVRLLFSNSEPGAWYDPSDIGTLFQDSAGTTPVTAVEQPVGLMLDKSGRGNHATQATTTKRPVLSRRVNLLLATATLATQSMTTQAAAYTLAFSGAGSVTLSGAATGTFAAGTHAITCTAGSLALTVAGAVNDADFRLATDAHLPYQRVNTATDYDADPAKFPAYLRFDGVDDALHTGNIDFTSTDKMTVWAGAEKANDNYAFLVNLVWNAVGSFRYETNNTIRAVSGLTPEKVASVTCVGNKKFLATMVASPGFVSVREGASGLYNEVTETSTGNFTSGVVGIGAASLGIYNFHGKIYSLIVRGAQSTLSQIEATELYMKKKVGIA